MKRLSLIIIPISVLMLGVFVFTNTKSVEAADGERASYKLSPWTFWQTGVTTDVWNPWELNAYKRVEMRDNADSICDPMYDNDLTPSTPNMNPRIYDGKFFEHSDPGTEASGEEKEVTVHGISHGYVANIESNGWSGKWDDPTVSEEYTDPPKWPTTDPVPTTTEAPTTVDPLAPTTEPVPLDNNPYTLRSWIEINGLKRKRTYTWKFDAYIDSGAYMAKREGRVNVDHKYCKIVGTNYSGKVVFVRYIEITTEKKTFMFNFDIDGEPGLDETTSAVETTTAQETTKEPKKGYLKVEMMYGAFLLPGPIIKHQEVVWTGTVHVENCDVIQGNMTIPPTTTKKSSGGGSSWDDDWGDTPAKVVGLKVKRKSKKSALLSWKSAEYADKYQINYALKKNFKGGKKKYTTKKKYTVKGLKRKKTYYFRVRGINNDAGAGPWSAKKKIKTK